MNLQLMEVRPLHMEPQTPLYTCVPSPFIGTDVTLTSSQQSLSLHLSHMTAEFVPVPVQGTHAHTESSRAAESAGSGQVLDELWPSPLEAAGNCTWCSWLEQHLCLPNLK